MRRIMAIIMAMLLVSCASAAFALNWTTAEAEKCTEYNLTADKYIKVESDIGGGYEKAATAVADVGDTVYFALSATDTKGDDVDAEIEYHNLGNVEPVGSALFKAQVVGPKPYVKISITEKSSIDELFYKNKPVEVDGDVVIIGNLVFLRNEAGLVIDVEHFENPAEMLTDLAELGIKLDDIYAGKISMTDDILISNFGKICKTEATAAWYEAAEAYAMGIPKTGDYSAIGCAILIVCIVGIVWFGLAAKRAKR